MRSGHFQKNLKSLQTTILQAMHALNEIEAKLICVTGEDGVLRGVVTDGDIRRHLMTGGNTDTPLSAIMNANPKTLPAGTNSAMAHSFMKRHSLMAVPLVDDRGVVCAVEGRTLFSPHSVENAVVFMAGGEGRRMLPLTEYIPKPMIEIGGRPILEHLLLHFCGLGFSRFYFSVNYLANKIIEHFGDGSRWNVEINYLRENQKLGTAGALSLIDTKEQHPLVVMNGDLMTDADIHDLIHFHQEQDALASMCVREQTMTVPYGVVDTAPDGRLAGIREKPVERFRVNAGIYCLSPQTIEMCRPNEPLDMPDLFRRLSTTGKAFVFDLGGFWVDIGTPQILSQTAKMLETAGAFANGNAARPGPDK